MEQKITVGMFCYQDRTFSQNLVEGKVVSGIAAFVAGNKVLVVGLREGKLPWSSDKLEVKESQRLIDGLKSTQKILALARKSGKKAEAAQWCHEYMADGVIKGEAFLPSKAELEKLLSNKAKINDSLKKLNLALLENWYWTSTEFTPHDSWQVFGESGHVDYAYKHFSYSVRPVFWIKLK